MEIKVEDMMCAHCVAKIEKALNKAGIEANVNLDSKTVSVNDGDKDQAIIAIEKAGYNPAL